MKLLQDTLNNSLSGGDCQFGCLPWEDRTDAEEAKNETVFCGQAAVPAV